MDATSFATENQSIAGDNARYALVFTQSPSPWYLGPACVNSRLLRGVLRICVCGSGRRTPLNHRQG